MSWWVTGTTAQPEDVSDNVAHFETEHGYPVCGVLASPHGRPYNVYQDVGRCPLCKKCREAIRAEWRRIEKATKMATYEFRSK